MIAVKKAFQHAWKGYTTYAFGHDMLKPISRRWDDWFSVGDDLMGLTFWHYQKTLFLKYSNSHSTLVDYKSYHFYDAR